MHLAEFYIDNKDTKSRFLSMTNKDWKRSLYREKVEHYLSDLSSSVSSSYIGGSITSSAPESKAMARS